MAHVATNEFKAGVKLEIDNQPYNIVSNQFVKPGKGQAFNRVRLKNLMTGRVIEKTFKSGDKCELADILETQMRMLYKDGTDIVFMDDESFDQVSISLESMGDTAQWLKEDTVYGIIFYKNNPINVEAPTFMELKITTTDPGVRGDTASGRVLKPAVTETGAKVQIPIFINEEETVKIDTRNGAYVSRVND